MSDTITITGNIATEPEHKRTPAGVAITTFRVASGQRRYDRNSASWVDAHTNWYTVSAFRGLAEHAFHSLKKGDRVILTGRLRLREWDTGAKKGISAEIDVEAIGHDLLFGTSRFERDASSAPQSAPAAEGDWAPAPAAAEWAVPGGATASESTSQVAEASPDEASLLVGADTPF
ncbi:single-stranded DNA-binding protein [Microbacterium sp. BK668]|uniref:single-stranded DNA-binding protein n=1 Tax=Microbacterium sp. BK668 TaxID=2512118 RepID=UPI00106031C9|nr:single-stranded DNA-binding protein [Microbacterium sp. BK668]TDN92741.1 single-strand DNA-binding protein [Microbacterium sp. BK668]